MVESLLTPAEAAPAPQAPTVVATGLGYPLGLTVGPHSPVYAADFGSLDGQAPGRILAVDPASGAVQMVFDADGHWPSDVEVDSAGNVYFTDCPGTPTVLANRLRDPSYGLAQTAGIDCSSDAVTNPAVVEPSSILCYEVPHAVAYAWGALLKAFTWAPGC